MPAMLTSKGEAKKERGKPRESCSGRQVQKPSYVWRRETLAVPVLSWIKGCEDKNGHWT